MKVVSLFSGGIDSTTLLYYLLAKKYDVNALMFNYGQRHRKELQSASWILDKLRINNKLVDIRNIGELIAKGSITGNEEVPEGHYAAENMKSTIVPNRNMIMLAIAVGYAETIGAERVAYAAHAGDHFIYPDCRPMFVSDLNKTIKDATEDRVNLTTPFICNTKAEIVKIGSELNVPFELTWSCYKGGEYHCGKCGTCTERKEAFKLARVKDPTIYLEKWCEE
jgi:7-cyano-7-deazaguanine synthase